MIRTATSLYVVWSIGNRLGQLQGSTALDIVNDQFVVLDFNMAQITVFEPTEYGRLVKEAVELHSERGSTTNRQPGGNRS